MKNKFSWGDGIIVIQSAPPHLHPGEFASVCGFYKITCEENAKELKCNLGDWIYTIEFSDGTDIQIPEIYLENYID